MTKTVTKLVKTYKEIKKMILFFKKEIHNLGHFVTINESKLYMDFKTNNFNFWMYHRTKNNDSILKLYINVNSVTSPNFIILIEELKNSLNNCNVYCLNFTNNIVNVLLFGKEHYLLTMFPFLMNVKPIIKKVETCSTINVGFVSTLGSNNNTSNCYNYLYNIVVELCKLLYNKAQILRQYVKETYNIDPRMKKLLQYGKLKPSFMIYKMLRNNPRLVEELKKLSQGRLTLQDNI